MEPAMNGTSGFQEVQSSASRSPLYRFLQEQQHRFGTDALHLLYTYDLFALATGIRTKREKAPNSISRSPIKKRGNGRTLEDAPPSEDSRMLIAWM